MRKQHLAKEPVCRACGSETILEVHHIRPFHLYPQLELEPGNLITLCERDGRDCHFTFGHFHNWANLNLNVVADVDHYNAERLEARIYDVEEIAAGAGKGA